MDSKGSSSSKESTTAKDWADLGNDLFSQGLFAESVEAYEKALEINPRDMESWNSRGLALCRLRNSELAAESFQRAIEIDREFLDAHNNIGVVHYGMEYQKRALEIFDLIIKKDSRYIKAWYNRGVIQEKQGNFESIESYDKAIEIDSEKPKIWNNRGAALGKMGRYEEAFELHRPVACPKTRQCRGLEQSGLRPLHAGQMMRPWWISTGP